MLPRLVALCAASAILLGLVSTVAASIGEPTHAALAARADVDYRAEIDGLPTLSEDALTPEALAALRGADLLSGLGQADQLTVERLASEHPGVVESLLANQTDISTVTEWWGDVEPAHRRALVDAVPRLIGNLEGIPYAVRNAANREHLARTIARLESAVERPRGRTAESVESSQLAMLRQVDLALGDPGTTPARSLIAVDETWPGQAVVALGDVDSADHVSYLVPGMFFTVQGQIVDWTQIALDVHRDKVALAAGSTTVATVAWMGYETPNIFTVGALDQAYEGAGQLDATVAGLRSVRHAAQPQVSLVTHSYGSTAASIALARGTLDIDAIAIVGSPGVSVDTAGALGLPDGGVFVAEASWDPVVETAYHGVDPGGADFGAVLMGVGGGLDAITGDVLTAVSGHLGYFDAGSESMRNFALIGLGRGDLVTGSGGRHLLAVDG